MPYGFRLEDGQVVTDDDEQVVVELVRRLSTSGASLRQIAAELAKAGQSVIGDVWTDHHRGSSLRVWSERRRRRRNVRCRPRLCFISAMAGRWWAGTVALVALVGLPIAVVEVIRWQASGRRRRSRSSTARRASAKWSAHHRTGEDRWASIGSPRQRHQLGAWAVAGVRVGPDVADGRWKIVAPSSTSSHWSVHRVELGSEVVIIWSTWPGRRSTPCCRAAL